MMLICRMLCACVCGVVGGNGGGGCSGSGGGGAGGVGVRVCVCYDSCRKGVICVCVGAGSLAIAASVLRGPGVVKSNGNVGGNSCGYVGGAGSGGRLSFVVGSYTGSLSVSACGGSGQSGYAPGAYALYMCDDHDVLLCCDAVSVMCMCVCVRLCVCVSVSACVLIRWAGYCVLECWEQSCSTHAEHRQLRSVWRAYRLAVGSRQELIPV